MSDAGRRALRTFIQSFLGVLLTSGILSAITTTGVVDWTVLKKVFLSGIAAGITAVLSWAQNALEDRGTIPEVVAK